MTLTVFINSTEKLEENKLDEKTHYALIVDKPLQPRQLITSYLDGYRDNGRKTPPPADMLYPTLLMSPQVEIVGREFIILTHFPSLEQKDRDKIILSAYMEEHLIMPIDVQIHAVVKDTIVPGTYYRMPAISFSDYFESIGAE